MKTIRATDKTKQEDGLRRANGKNVQTQWLKRFSAYTSNELRVLQFRSITELEKAIDLCWKDPDLKGVPRDTPDGRSLIVPQEAVDYFKAKGLRFRISTLLNPDDLSSKQLAALRRQHGM